MVKTESNGSPGAVRPRVIGETRAHDGSDEPPLPRLSRPQFWGCVAVGVVAFLFCTGPIWRHPWQIDTAIIYSYLPLPLLVLGCLAWSRRLTLRGYLLDLLSVTLLKYGMTLTIALLLWITSDPPPRPPLLRSFPAPTLAAETPPAPTPIAPESTGSLSGIVTSAEGRPVADALVFVEQGLEKVVFSPPREPLLLENDGTGVLPRVSGAQTYQRIAARSTDGRLHTLVAVSPEGPLFNVPLLSSGMRSDTVVREPHGLSRIRCAVHQGAAEQPSYLAVLSHPFFARTGQDGRFSWSGVPAGSLRVGAFHPELGRASEPAELAARGSVDLRLALRKSP